ncbi:MAG: hypothetical protein IT514_10455, partial [Burkholderiales bacterium]|nr:hypothetical protein [Burkholderiales bacterium]
AAGLIAAWILRARLVVAGLALAATAGCGYYLERYQQYLSEDTVFTARDFFGVLRVQESASADRSVRRLMHGVIMHGKQYLEEPLRREPTTYYGTSSGIGRLVQVRRGPGGDRALRIGVIGLGVGTMAAYGRRADVIRFYDISAQVIGLSSGQTPYFTYLSDSAARIGTVLGDARLALEREVPQRYDILVIDAFSSDAIPVHLITLEALDVYLRHLAEGGVVAFHVTNRYLDLPPVVKLLAERRGLASALVEDAGDPEAGASTDWVLVTKDEGVLREPALAEKSRPVTVPEGLSVWTDDFNNLFQVLK